MATATNTAYHFTVHASYVGENHVQYGELHITRKDSDSGFALCDTPGQVEVTELIRSDSGQRRICESCAQYLAAEVLDL